MILSLLKMLPNIILSRIVAFCILNEGKYIYKIEYLSMFIYPLPIIISMSNVISVLNKHNITMPAEERMQ